MQPSRRTFLADTGLGVTGLACGAMLFGDGVRRLPAEESLESGPQSGPHLVQRAKSVIWIFLCGGVSHLESFDIKPELNKYGGKSIDDTPYKDLHNEERINRKLVGLNPGHYQRKLLMPLQTGYQRYGECGLPVGDWFKHIGECADDLAVVRSLWTCHNDHGTQLTWHTGRHPREGSFPTVGSWATYGLGSMNQNLPDYVVLGVPTGDCCGGEWTYGADYLGPQYAGVRLNVAEGRSLPFVAPPAGQILPEEQRGEFSLLGKLNALSGIDYPDDQELRARIRSYELAFGMQTAVPDAVGWKLISVVRSTRSLPEPTFRCWLSQTKLVKCQVAWPVVCPCSVAAVFPGIFSSNQVPPELFPVAVVLGARCQHVVSRKWSQRPGTGVHNPDVSVLAICLGCDQWPWHQICSFGRLVSLEKR